jgi:hypothetical protein
MITLKDVFWSQIKILILAIMFFFLLILISMYYQYKGVSLW